MTTTTLSLDFETRGTVDLKRCGVYPYVEDPHFDVWCLAWAVDDMEPEIWRPGEPVPVDLLLALADPATELRAWNAAFERAVWRVLVSRYGFPAVPLERWHCTAADAAAMALPRNLDQCAAALRLVMQKDEEGHRLMLRLAKPRQMVEGLPVWWSPAREPERFRRLYDYCKQDVRVERAIYRATRRLDPVERRRYLLDQVINDRGVRLDIDLAHGLRWLSERGLEEANVEISDATSGAVERVTDHAALRRWVNAQGIETDSVRKSVVRDLLEGEHPDPVRRALEARADAGRSSVAKVEAALRAKCSDGLLRGLLLYYGANTGRWAGRLLQPQNFPRPLMKRPERYLDAVLRRDYDAIATIDPPLLVAASLLRGMLCARPGHRMIVGDFAGIEARMLNWLAEQDDMVRLFAEGGKVYERMAARIYGVSEAEIVAEGKDSWRRQMGKNTELGCGYGLGAKTFRTQVYEQTGTLIEETLAQDAVGAYRDLHPRVTEMWRLLEGAALNAVTRPGAVYEAARCRFIVRSGYLWLVLPSGRPLAYARPKVEERETPWGEMRDAVTAEQVNSETRKWERRSYYGGLWTENVIQALARDVMATAMENVERAGYPVVLTVHDEIVTDTPQDHGSLGDFTALMERVPEWARGCPINVETWEGPRYRK
jgi:DNA polymerase